MTRVACVPVVLALAAQANAAPTVHSSDFIVDANRSHFNGFESIPNDGTFFTGGGGPYTEDTIQVEQINGDAGNDIWITSSFWIGFQGARGWYPTAGDSGYTIISLTGGVDFQNVGFNYGTGFCSSPGVLFELLDDGMVVLSGTASIIDCDVAINYIGFSGGGFDTIRMRNGFINLGGTVTDGTIQALAIDNIETVDDEGDHYLSYEVKEMKGTLKFDKVNVNLTDQFETGTFEVKKLKALYNPVDKNGEGINDSDTHLVGYEIKRDKNEAKHVTVTNIQVDNQFGTLRVDTVKPDRLLVPSAKSVTGPVGELPLPLTVDHFKCYKIEVTEGTPEFVPVQVSLEDQFTSERVYEVDEPTRLCNPVDKNGEGFLDAEIHLLCYDVRRADITNIHVNNQFGPLQVETKKQKKELCVPSTKTLP